MADVFLSYQRGDKPRVERLAHALRASGLSVWWDDDIPPNAPWEATIEAALDEARSVIVLWSPSSIASENVKGEARRARHAGKLVQVFLEPCEPPLFFGERQGLDLSAWDGADGHADYQILVEAISALRDGRKPPAGVGYVAKRRPLALFALAPVLVLMAAPFQLDWYLALRMVLLAGFVFALLTRPTREIAIAFAVAALCSIGLDFARYRAPPSPYYLAECSFGQFDCSYGRSYQIGSRHVALAPLIWGRAHTLYVRAIAGERRFAQSFLRREQSGDVEVLLAPSEIATLAYVDGDAPTRPIPIYYQPVSSRGIASFPYANLNFEFSVLYADRPDVRNELAFAAGFARGATRDMLEGDVLDELGLSIPHYTASRNNVGSLAFSTLIDTNDTTALWRRAVANDILFQLQASNDLDGTLFDLAGIYPRLPEPDRLFIDTLTLSHWCGRVEEEPGLVACAEELARIAAAVDRLQASQLTASKLELIRQILHIVAVAKFSEGAQAGEVFEIGRYGAKVEATEALIAALLARYPGIRTYLEREVDEAAGTPRIDAEAMSIEALRQYVAASAQLSRSDRLEALLPTRRALADAYENFSTGDRDVWEWLNLVLDDLTPLMANEVVTPATVPGLFSLLRNTNVAIDARAAVHERYALVDAAIRDLGGEAPLFLTASRREIDDVEVLEAAKRTAAAYLIERIERGASAREIFDVLELEAVREVVIPRSIQRVKGGLDDWARVAQDLGISELAGCLNDTSRGLVRVTSQLRARGAPSRLVSELEALSEDDLESYLMRSLPASCEVYATFEEEDLNFRAIYDILLNNSLLRTPGAFFAEGLNDSTPISGRQYLLSTALDTEAGMVEFANWYAAEPLRVRAMLEAMGAGVDTPELEVEDFRRLSRELCSRWSEPVWAYPQLSNTSAGWRLSPIFFSTLRMSLVCGTPTNVLRDHLEASFGKDVVDAYLAARSPGEARLALGRRVAEDARADLLAQSHWHPADARNYARLRLFEGNVARWWRVNPARRPAVTALEECRPPTCDVTEMRTITAAMMSFAQMQSRAHWLHETVSDVSVFPYATDLIRQEHFWNDAEEQWELNLTSIPNAFGRLARFVDRSTLQILADSLPGNLTAAQYQSLAARGSTLNLDYDGAYDYWVALQTIFGQTHPELALEALEHLARYEGGAAVIGARRTQLMLRAGLDETATDAAIAYLEAEEISSDDKATTLALENARQVLMGTTNCVGCWRRLVPATLDFVVTLESRHAVHRSMLNMSGLIAEEALRLNDAELRAVAASWADRVLRQDFYRSGASAEDIVWRPDVRSALQIRAQIAPSDAVPERELLLHLTEDPAARPSARLLETISSLSVVAGGGRGNEIDVWIARAARDIRGRLTADEPLTREILADLHALFALTTTYERATVLDELADALSERLQQDYDAGNYPVTPPQLYYALTTSVSEAPRLSNATYRAYLESEAFRKVGESGDAGILQRELEGLRRILVTNEEDEPIFTDESRPALMSVAQAYVVEAPDGLSAVVASVLKRANPEAPISALIFAVLDQEDGPAGGAGFLPVLQYIVRTRDAEAAAATTPAARADADARYLRLVDQVVNSRLALELSDDCCVPATERTEIFLAMVRDRLESADRCAWLTSLDVDVAAFVRLASIRGADTARFGPRISTLDRSGQAGLCPS